MLANVLCQAIRRISLGQKTCTVRYHSTQLLKNQRLAEPFSASHFQYSVSHPFDSETQIKFVPRTLKIDFEVTINDGLKKNIIEAPFRKIPCLKDPVTRRIVYEDLPIIPNKPQEFPTASNTTEKLAARLLVIRRRKMKKHKRKKLRKKMQHTWATLRLKRALKREKEFQAELLAQIHEAEKFDPQAYVADRIEHLNKEYLPLTYRGEVLPKEMIKQFMKEREEKQKQRQNRPHLTL